MMLALVLLMLLASAGAAIAEPVSLTVAGTAAVSSTAVVSTGTAAAAAAVTTAAAPVITAATVGTFLVNLGISAGISLGLSLLSKALAGKPKAGETLSGLEANVQIGGDIARQIALGLVGAKGHLVYHNSPPDINHKFYQQVYVLSDWLSGGLSTLFVNGKAATLAASPAGGGLTYYVPGEHASHLSLAFYDGSQAAADSALVSLAQPAGKWTADSRLTGMSYVVASWTYEKGAPIFEGGIPRLTFGLLGARLYDWRKPGHVWNDPNTWEFSENPAVAVYNYLRGFYKAGELLMGMGVPESDILLDTFTAAANICDEPVTLDGGGSEARYRLCTFLSADQSVTHAQTLEVLLSTMAGYLYDYGGFYYLQAGAGYSTVATITDNDLVTGAGLTFAAKRTRGELINRIHGQFLRPSDEFQPASYTPQVSTSAVAADGEELGTQLDLASVPSQFQAERISQIRLREVRRQATATVTLGFNHLDKQVGDWLTWDSARYNIAGAAKIFRIVNKMVDPFSQTVTLEMSETAANVYSWTTADEGDHVPAGVRLQGTALITQPTAFLVQAITLTDAAGNQVPGLRFSWNPILDPTVDAVVIEWRKVGTAVASRVSDPSVGDGTFQTTDGIVGGLNYEARATITTTPPRITTWTNWVTVTTTASFFDLGSAVDPASSIPTGLVLSSFIDSATQQTVLAADWNLAVGDPKTTYEIEIKDGADASSLGNYISFPTATNRYTIRGLPQGRAVRARVRSITGMGTQSGWSPEVPTPPAVHIILADSVPPGPVTSFSAEAAFETVFLFWTNPTDKDLQRIEVYESATNDRATATVIARVAAPGNTYIRVGLAAGTPRYYWVRPFDTSGNAGPYTPNTTAGEAETTLNITTTQITDGAVTTPKMIANTILGDRILTGSMDANRVQASTVLAGTVVVGDTGIVGGNPTIAQTAARADDPAVRVNAKTTLIEPGKVLIAGSTTLSNWRTGPDLTEINGGAIRTNTIDANRIKIGARGLDIYGCQFQVTRTAGGALTDNVSWTDGTITYLADNGIATPVNITGSNTDMAVGACIFWQKGNSVFFYANPPSSVTGGDNVIMAIYLGGGALNIMYGGTIIDGTQISTRSINATRIQVNSLTATELIQTEAIITNSAMIANATIGTLKVLDGSMSAVYAGVGTPAHGADVSTVAFNALEGRRYLVTYMGNDPNAGRVGANPSPTARIIVLFVQAAGIGDSEIGRSQAWDAVDGFLGGNFTLNFPNIAGSVVWEAPADNFYLFYVRNFTGLPCNISISATELKR